MRYLNRNHRAGPVSEIVPWFTTIYIFCRWYKIYSFLTYVMFAVAAIVVVQLLFSLFTRKNALKVSVVLLFVYIDYFAGMIYSQNLVGQKGYSVVMLFCLLMAFSYIQKEKNGQLAFSILTVFSAISCVGIALQALYPPVINWVNQLILQPEAYKAMRFALQNGYITGINGYVYLSAFFSLIFFATAFIHMLSAFESKQKARLLDILIMTFAVATLILTQKRAMLVCFLVANIVLVCICLRRRPKLMGKVIAVLVFLAILIAIFATQTAFGRVMVLRFFDAEDISSGRFGIYGSVIDSVKGSLFFGRGTGSAYLIYASGIHNIYLQILHDNGILGLLLWVTLFLFVLFDAIKKAALNKFSSANYLAVYIQVSFLVYGLFGNPLFNNALLMLYFITLGYTYSIPSSRNEAMVNE